MQVWIFDEFSTYTSILTTKLRKQNMNFLFENTCRYELQHFTPTYFSWSVLVLHEVLVCWREASQFVCFQNEIYFLDIQWFHKFLCISNFVELSKNTILLMHNSKESYLSSFCEQKRGLAQPIENIQKKYGKPTVCQWSMLWRNEI